MRGGKSAVSKIVCANKRAFACFFDHGSCAPLVAQARGAGAPGSKGSMYSQCRASSHLLLAAAKEPEAEPPAGGEEAPPAQAAEASQEVDAAVEGEGLAASVATGNACDHGLVASIGKKAPGCLSACSGSCAPLSQAIGAYMRGGKSAVSKIVCANKRAFACFFDHGSCAPLVAQAKGAGAPGSKGSLYSQCK